jgi:hypothetical protein
MLDLFLVGVAGIAAGFALCTMLLARGIRQVMESEESESIQSIVEQLAANLVFLRVEQANNLCLAYDAVSGEFVCQGTNMQELLANFGQRYPGKRGVLVEPESGEARELV